MTLPSVYAWASTPVHTQTPRGVVDRKTSALLYALKGHPGPWSQLAMPGSRPGSELTEPSYFTLGCRKHSQDGFILCSVEQQVGDS